MKSSSAKFARECGAEDLADDKESFVGEGVGWDFQVEGRWPLADATASVVMRSVAGAVVAAVVTGVGDWHAAQVSAHTEDDEPLRVLGALVVVLNVAEGRQGDRLFDGDFFGGTMTDEERLASPLEGDVLAFWDVGQLDLDLGQGQDVSGGAHRADEFVDEGLGGVGGCNGGT